MSVVGRTIGGTVAAALLTAGTACSLLPEESASPNDLGPAISRQTDGVVALNGGVLRPVYQGRYVSPSERAELERNGLALSAVVTIETACQGVMLLYDTDEEADQRFSEFWTRHQDELLAPSTPGDTSDPCEPYAGSPSFVTE